MTTDNKLNIVWLCQCKTGFQTLSKVLRDNFESTAKTYGHYYKTWETDKYIIHKVNYKGIHRDDDVNIINNIKNPQYLIIIRNPIKRFLSCYNYCIKREWMDIDIEEYNSLYDSLNNNDSLSDTVKHKITAHGNYSLVDVHSRYQFEYLDIFNISIKDISYILRTEYLTSDIKKLFKSLFNIDYNDNIIENVNSNYAVKDFNYNKNNKTIERELKIYNSFNLSKLP